MDHQQLIMDEGVPDFGLDVEEFSTNVLSFDIDTGSFYLDVMIYEIFRLLNGPLNVISSYQVIIVVAFWTRFAHLIIDLSNLRPEIIISIKNIATCYFGIYQLSSYNDLVTAPGQPSLLPFLFFVIFLATIVTRVSKLGSPEKSFRCMSFFATIIATPILANEYLVHYKQFNHHTNLRPIFMILAMKMTSEVFSGHVTDFQSTIAYFLHPASCILGPWHTQRISISESHSRTKSFILQEYIMQLSQMMIMMLVTLGTLFISTNVSELIAIAEEFGLSGLPMDFIKMYLTAFEFRFSHYFACFLSLTLMKLWEREDKLRVCDVIRVEYPRSLVEVVISWNIQMHRWLKHCVFDPLIESRLSLICAILVTYVCSSTLHGFKFHIWAVLLTLGFATWIEHRVRNKLAVRLKACVLPKRCRYNHEGICIKQHKRTDTNSWLVTMINMVFRLLTIVQLAYLGSIFVGNTDEASYVDALKIWSDNYCIGHIICIIMCIVNLLIDA